MPDAETPRNRGPAVAPANRAALIAAGRRQFAAHGYGVPLSAIARDAGVGQGVLYRHFGTRLALALAIFTENIEALEATAATHREPETIALLVRTLVEQTLASAAFVEAVVRASAESDWAGGRRVVALLEAPLARALAAGHVRPDLTVDDVVLLVSMVHGIGLTHRDPTAARAAAARAVLLVDPFLGAAIEG